jgi:hypothetical protein
MTIKDNKEPQNLSSNYNRFPGLSLPLTLHPFGREADTDRKNVTYFSGCLFIVQVGFCMHEELAKKVPKTKTKNTIFSIIWPCTCFSEQKVFYIVNWRASLQCCLLLTELFGRYGRIMFGLY